MATYNLLGTLTDEEQKTAQHPEWIDEANRDLVQWV